ncbi:MAG: ABC transporter permease [Reyranella sp.]|uniref:ABC transporter permease n=1 Tax=Reyranella sp. TaxID=1929291 RepID=UPI003D0F0182
MVIGLLDRKLLRDLWHLRGQGLGIVLVLACAGATVVMSFSVQHSLFETRADYYRRCGFADLFATLPPAPLSLADAVRRIPGVATVAARVVGSGGIALDGIDEPIPARMISLPEPDGPAINGLALQQGRIPAGDRPDEVVIDAGFAKAHGLGPGSRLAMTIGGHRRTLIVVGTALSPEFIFALGPGQIVPDDRRFAIVWQDRRALAEALRLGDRFNDLAMRLAPGASASAVSEAVDRLLAADGGGDAVHDRGRQQSHAFVQSQLEELGAVGILVPAIFLGVAVFLLHASMLRVIELQRPEIGIVKALGFDDATVGRHYVKFALALAIAASLLGLPVGVALGRVVTQIYAGFFRFPFLHYEPDLPAVAGVILVLGAAAAIAALQPAARAAALPPARALLPPTPASPRAVVGEQMVRRLGVPAVLVLRQLARHPLRVLLTTFAAAFAVGLQIATLFSFDALDEMVDVFYGRAQRQDATITFAAPLPLAALADIARWPGMRRIEGRLDLPARLTLRGVARDVVLTGLPADGTLQRLLDTALEPVSLAEGGLAVSRRLAEILGARTGDSVTVSPATGRPFDIAVAAIVEQYIGLGAYMDLAALGRRLDSGPIVTGAEVKLADKDRTDFLRALKASSVVASYMPRTATIVAFRETMARTLTIIVSAFVAFAAVAAFAIVDATVRVALSERLRELAILRALGFGESTILLMLAGELAFAVALALPLGAAVGIGLGQVIVWTLDNDLFHVPLVVGWRSYAIAIGIVLAAAVVSFALAARRVRKIDVPAALRAAAT